MKTIDAVAVSHENKQRSCETRKQGAALVSNEAGEQTAADEKERILPATTLP